MDGQLPSGFTPEQLFWGIDRTEAPPVEEEEIFEPILDEEEGNLSEAVPLDDRKSFMSLLDMILKSDSINEFFENFINNWWVIFIWV